MTAKPASSGAGSSCNSSRATASTTRSPAGWRMTTKRPSLESDTSRVRISADCAGLSGTLLRIIGKAEGGRGVALRGAQGTQPPGGVEGERNQLVERRRIRGLDRHGDAEQIATRLHHQRRHGQKTVAL